MSRGITAMAAALICFGFAGCKPTPEFKIPPEETSRANPVEFTASSVAEGKSAYDGSDCAICHGKFGNGGGVLASDAKMNLRDWRKPGALVNYTDGDLAYIISKGKRRMPAYGSRVDSRQIWRMVDYIRSLSRQ